MAISLAREFEFYLENKDALVEQYGGRFIVIKDGCVIGDYDSDFDAVTKTSQQHRLGTFLVQKCDPSNSSHIATFHSRVSFE